MDFDFAAQPLGRDNDGRDVYLKASDSARYARQNPRDVMSGRILR